MISDDIFWLYIISKLFNCMFGLHMEVSNMFCFLFDIFAAGVPNLAYVESVDDEKVHIFVS